MVTKRACDDAKTRVEKINVLSEEEYTKSLEKIIKRDFFPDLDDLKLQQEYNNAIQRKDLEAVRALLLKHSDKPWLSTISMDIMDYSENPSFRGNDESDIESKIRKQGLDEFMKHNTSCDNVSFEMIMEQAEKVKKAKVHHSWLYEQEKVQEKKNDKLLELPSCSEQASISNPGTIETWPYKAKNTLMYYPEANENSVPVKRTIVHSNTRLKEVRNAVALTPKLNNSSSRIEVDGTETPKVRGYSFVAATPSPSIITTPIMTWGKIEGTPLPQDTPSFRIPETPQRDEIARDLADKAGASLRRSKETALRCIKKQSFNGFSPAAQRLLSSFSPARKSDFGSITEDLLHIVTPKGTPACRRSLQ